MKTRDEEIESEAGSICHTPLQQDGFKLGARWADQTNPDSKLLDAAMQVLENISKRPDLPNPNRDADWKSCMKWSSHEAREALQKIKQARGGK